MHLQCPTCGANEVDRNESDYFECRACHVQYSCSELDRQESAEIVVLNTAGDNPFRAVVLTEKGSGKFPLDIRIEEAVVALQRAREKH